MQISGTIDLDNPEINPHVYGQLSFNKGGKIIQWGKGSLFNKQCWENWTAATHKRIKLDHYFTPYTKNSLKMDSGLECKT